MNTETMTTLESKIKERTAHITVIGMGYVGLPLAYELANAGFKVVGLEKDPRKVEKLKVGDNYIYSDKGALKRVVDSGNLEATLDPSILKETDIAIICVPTPLNKYREPDVSYIVDSTNMIAEHFHPGMLVSLESTTYPGTTDELLLPILEKSGLKVGKDFYLIFSPERVDPGNPVYHTGNTPKVIGGVTPECSKLGKDLYCTFIEKVHAATSTKAAEMEKLYENIFRAVNIALVNEMALLCKRMGISVWEVIELAKTKPYGFMPFYPGPGLGGHCIPIDPFYLTWKAREYDFSTRFIELAGEINTRMPYEVVNLVSEALSSQNKCIKCSRILLMGMAYKKDIEDTRESPSVKLYSILKERGAIVDFNDPYVDTMKLNGHVAESVKDPDYSEYDCVLISTAHSSYDYDRIVKESPLVVDTRNATRQMNNPKVFVL